MNFMNRPCLLAVFLVSIFFTHAAHAIIIDSYTAHFQDGSQLVVDLKSYDYGAGSYYASPTAWNEPPFPPVEGFETFFYPSLALQQLGITPGLIGDSFGGFGLDFVVNELFGVSMTSFAYLAQAPDWTVGDYGIHVQYYDYHTEFSGGFFKTRTSPYNLASAGTTASDIAPVYQVDGPQSLALMMIGMAGLLWVRRFRKA